MSHFRVKIDDIPKGGLHLRMGEGDAAWREVLAEASDGRGSPRGTASASVHRRSHRVEVQGRYQVDLVQVCGRCQEDFPLALGGAFQANLLIAPQGHAPGQEVELREEDLDDSFLQGDSVDVLDLLREQILLDLPPKPLCSEDCRGICPDCGAQLNTEACRCPGARPDSPFSGLANLRIDR